MGSPLYSGVQLDIRYKRPEHFLSIFLEENKIKTIYIHIYMYTLYIG